MKTTTDTFGYLTTYDDLTVWAMELSVGSLIAVNRKDGPGNPGQILSIVKMGDYKDPDDYEKAKSRQDEPLVVEFVTDDDIYSAGIATVLPLNI